MDRMQQCSVCLTFAPEGEIVVLDVGGSKEKVCHDCYPEVARVFDAPKVVHEEEADEAVESVSNLRKEARGNAGAERD